MAYGTKTANVMDTPLAIASVVNPYLKGGEGITFDFDGSNSIRVLSVANGTLVDYNETSAETPFGNPSLVVPDEQVLAIAYNKAMLLRIQKTQLQDIPVNNFAKKVALQQAEQVFVPAHDAYSLGKILAARPAGNKMLINLVGAAPATNYVLKFNQTIDKARTGGANINSMIAWVAYAFSTLIKDKINYTGSDAGYTAGQNGYLGKIGGVKIVDTPDAYLGTGVYTIVADKRAIVHVPPKMDPKDDVVILDKVPKFSGIEIQLRDRADTFVLNKSVNTVASLEEDPAA